MSVAVIPSEYKPAFALLLLVIGLLTRPSEVREYEGEQRDRAEQLLKYLEL